MAFSDELIRAIVKVGGFSDPAAEKHLADVLIKRRNRIGRDFLPAINPIVAPALTLDGLLTFRNVAVDAGVASPPARYQAVWSRFDNLTRQSQRIGETSGMQTSLAAPPALPADVGAYLHVAITATAEAHPSWAVPVNVYFRRQTDGWMLVGLERMD
jgi:hypothetical protein